MGSRAKLGSFPSLLTVWPWAHSLPLWALVSLSAKGYWHYCPSSEVVVRIKLDDAQSVLAAVVLVEDLRACRGLSKTWLSVWPLLRPAVIASELLVATLSASVWLPFLFPFVLRVSDESLTEWSNLMSQISDCASLGCILCGIKFWF